VSRVLAASFIAAAVGIIDGARGLGIELDTLIFNCKKRKNRGKVMNNGI
jgi:hypothetical protein